MIWLFSFDYCVIGKHYVEVSALLVRLVKYFHVVGAVTQLSCPQSKTETESVLSIWYLPTPIFKVGTGQPPFQDVALCFRDVSKFRRLVNLHLNIEGLTASKMSVLHHLATMFLAPVIFLQEIYCTSADKLVLPNYHYHLAGFSLSRNHGLATFVYERLQWTIIDQYLPTSDMGLMMDIR